MAWRVLVRRVCAVIMRSMGLAGRFIFIFSAAFYMEPHEFGIYGLIVAASYVIIQLAGIEAFAIVMRRVASPAVEMEDDRPFYGRFVLLSAGIAFGAGVGFSAFFQWEWHIVLLAGLIIALEYVGVEAVRILVAEKRPNLALYAASLRFTIWSLGFPALTFAGILAGPWPLEWVLGAWFISALLSLIFLVPILARYLAPLESSFVSWYRAILKGSPCWILIALAPRFLESGVRLVPGIIVDEVAAGQFVFLATLAGLGAIGVRSVIEPFFFSAMLDPSQGQNARQRFGLISIGFIALGTLGSLVGWLLATDVGGKELGESSGVILALLLIASSATSLAQVAHYRLYAHHEDRKILIASILVLLVGIPLVVGLTAVYGLVGTAIGTTFAASMLLALKGWLAKTMRLGPDGKRLF